MANMKREAFMRCNVSQVQETGDRRQETGDRRQETGDRRQGTGGSRRARISDYLSGRTATPGSSMPARNSSVAPPPVEICEILSATPAALMAFSESPPPTTETAPDCATALAMATVP